MRLTDIYEVCEKSKINLNTPIKSENISGGFRISNFQNKILAIKELDEIGIFSNLTTPIKSIKIIFENTQDVIIVDNSSYSSFVSGINQLTAFLNIFVESLNKSLLILNKNELSIKISKSNDLEELSRNIKDISNFISRLSIKSKLSGFDVGTEWVRIIIENKEEIMFLGTILKGIYDFCKNHVKTKYILKQDTDLLDSDEEKKELELLNEKIENKKIERYVSEIIDQHNEIEIDKQVIEESFRMGVSLVKKGTEFHISSTFETSIKNTFPSKQEVELIFSKMMEIQKQSIELIDGKK